jgi:probable phosphoglycerate mutase
LEPDLHERRVGALSGIPFVSDEIWPDTVRRWMAGETSFAPTGAESFDQIRDRVVPVWRRLANEFAGRALAIIAHGVVCKVLLLTLVDGWSVADWKRIGPVPNAAMHELVGAAHSWQVLRLNEIHEAVRLVYAAVSQTLHDPVI